MKIAILDSFIQTIDYSKPVQGGLARSSMMDAEAMATRHNVHYVYYGEVANDKSFTTYSLGPLTPPDQCLKMNKKTRDAHYLLSKDIPLLLETIAKIDPDGIFIHVVSKSKYLEAICKKFYDTPRVFIFHDGVSNNDLFGTIGIISKWLMIKKYNGMIVTNSEYTRDTIYQVLIDREDDCRRLYPEIMKQIPDVHNINLVDKAFNHFVYYKK